MATFLQQVINGLAIGCIYGLLGLGFSMVFGVLRMVNFTHGEIFMLGPMFSISVLIWSGIAVRTSSTRLTMPSNAITMVGLLILVFGSAVLVSVAAGMLTERAVFRRLRSAPRRNLLLSSLATSIVLANTAMVVLGANVKGFPRILPTKYWAIGGAILSNMQVVILALTILLMAVLLYVVNRTYLGRCIRAVAEDQDAASLMGVDINKVVPAVFAIGSAVGGASGVLFSMYYGQAYYYMGSVVGIKGWTAAVLGGIGNFEGSVFAGLLLGMLESVGGGYLPVVTRGLLGFEYKDILGFIALVLVLKFKPEGLFGGSAK